MKPQWKLIVPLAALGIVRALLHVNHVYDSAPRVEGAVWIATLVTWIAVVVTKKADKPLSILVLTGALSGVFAAMIQQLYWKKFWMTVQNYDTLPVDILDPVVRAIAAGSSVITGAAWGLAAGLVAALLSFLLRPKKTLQL